MQISGKNIILTGASSGIGAELLQQLIKYSDIRIIAVARHVDHISEIKNKVYPFCADVSTKEGVDSVFAYAQSVFGDTDIFIANAGFGNMEKIESADWKKIEDIYRLNVFSPIYSLEKLIEEGRKHKVFVCNISAVAFVPLPRYSLYCSTKAALHQFFETFNYEKNDNIQISKVYPIATRTSFFRTEANNKQPYIPYPSQDATIVASKIIQGIKNEKRNIYMSFSFNVMRTLSRIFPVILKIYAANEKRRMDNWSRI